MLVILETEKNCEFAWPDGDIIGKDDNFNSIADHQTCNSNIEECLYLAPCNEDEWYDTYIVKEVQQHSVRCPPQVRLQPQVQPRQAVVP